MSAVALVTGAGSGIGAASALVLAQRGFQVFCADVNSEGVVRTVNAAGGTAIALDISSETAVVDAIAGIIKECGRIDALVNSAGITGVVGKPSHELETAEFRRVIDVNLMGAVHLTNAVLPHMLKAEYGRIVHVTSIAGKEGNPNMAPYNASKAGMIGYVKGVAKEVAKYGVTINAVAPAVIRTPMNSDVTDEVMKYMVSRIPMARLGEPEEVAELIAFIASPQCSFTTGFVFDASGGRATY